MLSTGLQQQLVKVLHYNYMPVKVQHSRHAYMPQRAVNTCQFRNQTKAAKTMTKNRARTVEDTMQQRATRAPKATTNHQQRANYSPAQRATAQTRIPLVHLDATSDPLQHAIGVSLLGLLEHEGSVEVGTI